MKLAPLFAAMVLLFALVFVATGIHTASAQQAPPPPAGTTFKVVGPIFEGHCFMCHVGAKAAKSLRLDSYDNVMKGGENGKVVDPGQPGKSELFQRITGAKKPRMPKNGPPWVTEKETALIEQWIATGAQR
ncbi:MAG: c-type cytochrome domain-containing protein [Syntrophobacteraceae bacterium]